MTAAMDKTLYIHIGHYKTGTTALQVFLQRSGQFLAKNGLQYPDIWSHNAKHSAFAFSLLRAAGVKKMMYDYRDPTPPARMWGDLFEHISGSEVAGTIISSEEFMRIGQFPAAQTMLKRIMENRPEGLRVRAIAYLRDPDSHLQSWYNQLVKMSFPVADLNAAVDGDIEEIHIDYRRALEPWQQILGAENVEIRPYIRDPENADALHRDFMQVLGVDLPQGFVRMERDPNPRFDDRVLELVRLMQNMDFPRGTISAIRTQAVAYLEAQDRLVEGRRNGMDEARDRARAGLDWLATQPHSKVSAGDYANRLPQGQSQQVTDRNLLLGFVFSEFIQLRQRVNAAALPELTKRLDALEARLAELDRHK
jgi:hypothetical protein